MESTKEEQFLAERVRTQANEIDKLDNWIDNLLICLGFAVIVICVMGGCLIFQNN